MTCTVTGTLKNAKDKPRAGVAIRFVVGTTFATSDTSYESGQEGKTVTGATGEFEIAVPVPDSGTVDYAIYIGDNTTPIIAYLSEDLSPIDLAEIILGGTTPVDIDSTSSIVDARLAPAFVVLTDAAAVVWALTGKPLVNAKVTLGGNRTLSITGAENGARGRLIVIQDGTGSRTLTLPAGSKVINGGAGLITLSSGIGDIDILDFTYDGTSFFWTYGLDFTGV